MAVVFGSPEAKAILEMDKELQRQDEEAAKRNSREWIDARLEEIESEVEDLQTQIGVLLMEQDDLLAKKRARL